MVDSIPVTTYRHPKADVLVGLERLEHLIHGAEDGTPVRLAVSNGRDADVWNLRTVVEELRAQMEEHVPSPAGTVRVAVRTEVDAEALGDLASDLAEAVAARLLDRLPVIMPAGMTGIVPRGDVDLEYALSEAVKLVGQGGSADLVVKTARTFAALLTGREFPITVEDLEPLVKLTSTKLEDRGTEWHFCMEHALSRLVGQAERGSTDGE